MQKLSKICLSTTHKLCFYCQTSRKKICGDRFCIPSVLRQSLRIWKSGKESQVSGGCSARMLSISTANKDQNISLCSTSKSLNQANACKHNNSKCLVLKRKINQAHLQTKGVNLIYYLGVIHLIMFLNIKMIPFTILESKDR